MSKLFKKIKRLVKKLKFENKIREKLINFLLLGIFAAILVNTYTDLKSEYQYKKMLKEEVVQNSLLAGRYNARNNQFWYYSTEVWEAGLQNGYVLDLNIEYQTALVEVYRLISIAHANIDELKQFKSFADIQDSTIPNNTALQKSFIDEKNQFEEERIEWIKTLSKDIRSDIERALKLREITFWDWLSSLLW